MVCFAADTGTRRGELLRLQIADIDFEGKAILFNEKKRARGKRTTRQTPLSPFPADVLKNWLAAHPPGPDLFCNRNVVGRSKKRSATTDHKSDTVRSLTIKGRLKSATDRQTPGFGPITENEARHHLRRTLQGSRWEVIKSWHVAHHSFASNCAAKGIHQRLIDRWLGHTTDEMRRRYPHFIPNQEQEAIGAVFG